MNTQTCFIDELSSRVCKKLVEEQLICYLVKDEPLLENEELVREIKNNLDDYLSPEEQTRLLIKDLGDIENEEVHDLMIRLAIEIAALEVQMAIYKALAKTVRI
jgi:hypothetical protein